MFIASTLEGMEAICKKEVKGEEISTCRIQFDRKPSEIKSALVVYEKLAHFKFKEEKDLQKQLQEIYFEVKDPFRVDCHREGTHKFGSQEVKEFLGEFLYKKGHKVNLHHPKTIVYVDIKDKECFVGLNPENVGKRSYRIRGSRQALNATIAYGLLKIADYKNNDLLLDPFCNDGVILIEAGLEEGKKLYGFNDYLENVKINSFNAKVKIELHNEELDWLGTLFKENSVDKIITQPDLRKKDEMKEMFNQAKTILKDNGLIVMISPKIDVIEKIAKNYGFKGKNELSINNGDIKYEIMSFTK